MSVEERESGEDLDGGGGGRRGTSVDPTMVEVVRHRGAHRGGVIREAVGEAPAWT
jgi:hypothetical protein